MRVGVPRPGRWEVALDTSGFDEFGTPSQAGRVLEAQPVPADGQPYSVEVTVAKLSAVYLTPVDEAAAQSHQEDAS
jgi:1,4-alpha-glucan branching enzyme